MRAETTSEVCHVEHIPARIARYEAWPQWVTLSLQEAYTRRGITTPYPHQVEAANHAREGRHVVVATGTASGKSLVYQLPILTTLGADPAARALYLAPTKALTADQFTTTATIATETGTAIAATYDGDTPSGQREWVRANATWIFTNPDMLHASALPGHGRWAKLWRGLKYIVIDECHTYRGAFGSHIALLMRRIRRLAAHHGSEPTFILTSATVAEPERFCGALIGADVTAVTTDGSPRGATTFVLSRPPAVTNTEPPTRRSVASHAAHRLADLVTAGQRSLVFTRSRHNCETITVQTKQILGPASHTVAAYRAGYLADDRRELEAQIRDGRLRGLATTTALELGIDIAGLDTIVIAGYPGTLAALWQQAGRAGRAGDVSTVEFIARPDPLDTYLVSNPDAIFGKPVEASVIDPSNPYILGPHLACAAAEAPLTADDLAHFPGDTNAALSQLAEAKLVRNRADRWYWIGRGNPTVSLRGGSGVEISIIDVDTGQLLGTSELDNALSTLHTGAIYLHQGTSYLVTDLDLDSRVALVTPTNVDYTTQARRSTDIHIRGVRASCELTKGSINLGEVVVTSTITGYRRRRVGSGEIIDETPLELPSRELVTTAVWWTAPDGRNLAGALHAAEHAAIGLLPLFATCDRADIGGLSTAAHPDTAAPTIFVYDGHPGGAGFAERGFHVAGAWLGATLTAITMCECEDGCPACVFSPKCGNGNSPLDKTGAAEHLSWLVPQLVSAPGIPQTRK